MYLSPLCSPVCGCIRRKSSLKLLMLAILSVFGIGCVSKPAAKLPPPPPPTPPAVSIEAAPSTLQPGESAVLTWKTENSTDTKIEPLGSVEASGSKSVTPSQSTTYRIIGKGPGGQQQATVRVTVMSPVSAAASQPEEELFSTGGARQDVFFDTDEYAVRPDQEPTVASDASFLKSHSDLRILIEGHCDELGSTEYNLALGESRAQSVKSLIVKAGVNPTRIATISYGKEHPFCFAQSEDCYRLNRRAHIVPVSEP